MTCFCALCGIGKALHICTFFSSLFNSFLSADYPCDYTIRYNVFGVFGSAFSACRYRSFFTHSHGVECMSLRAISKANVHSKFRRRPNHSSVVKLPVVASRGKGKLWAKARNVKLTKEKASGDGDSRGKWGEGGGGGFIPRVGRETFPTTAFLS